MLQVMVFVALVFSIIIAIFAVQNTTSVDVAFLTLRAERVAVSVLVLISAALGAAAMLLLGLAREVRTRWRQRRLSQELQTARNRIRELEAREPASTAVLPAPRSSTLTGPEKGGPPPERGS